MTGSINLDAELGLNDVTSVTVTLQSGQVEAWQGSWNVSYNPTTITIYNNDTIARDYVLKYVTSNAAGISGHGIINVSVTEPEAAPIINYGYQSLDFTTLDTNASWNVNNNLGLNAGDISNVELALPEGSQYTGPQNWYLEPLGDGTLQITVGSAQDGLAYNFDLKYKTYNGATQLGVGVLIVNITVASTGVTTYDPSAAFMLTTDASANWNVNYHTGVTPEGVTVSLLTPVENGGVENSASVVVDGIDYTINILNTDNTVRTYDLGYEVSVGGVVVGNGVITVNVSEPVENGITTYSPAAFTMSSNSNSGDWNVNSYIGMNALEISSVNVYRTVPYNGGDRGDPSLTHVDGSEWYIHIQQPYALWPNTYDITYDVFVSGTQVGTGILTYTAY